MFGKYSKAINVDSLPNNGEKKYPTNVEGMISRSIELYTIYKEGNLVYCINENSNKIQIYYHEGYIKIRTKEDLSRYSGKILIRYDKESECAI